jgi:hypothetical protein
MVARQFNAGATSLASVLDMMGLSLFFCFLLFDQANTQFWCLIAM